MSTILDNSPPEPAGGPRAHANAPGNELQKTQQQSRRDYAEALVKARALGFSEREDGAVTDPRWKQLIEISNDGSYSADARECAFHDLALEFPLE
jgi:hypothetical protein